MKEYFGSEQSDGVRLAPEAQAAVKQRLAAELSGLRIYERSATAVAGGLIVAARDGERRKLVICGSVDGFADRATEVMLDGAPLLLCDADAPAMAALRKNISWLNPKLTGTTPSVGLGDRIGLATPGHIAADPRSGFILVLAQQSIREMTRTQRTAQQVMDEAVFGVFEVGYDRGFGSDADHLKTKADVDVTAAAGFTFYTIDPSAHVDDTVESLSQAELAQRFQQLLDDDVPGAAAWKSEYVGQSFSVGCLTTTFDEPTLLKAAVKYGRAIAHSVEMARYISSTVPESELELSVDETESPTSVREHLFIARELSKRDVKLTSLAPRFVGDFEKGIDYKGDLAEFEARLKDHVEIARHFGPYKISLHSGSDKFAVYPIVARVTGGLFHLKTAGTSYLEALRVVARHDIPMLRELIRFCRGRFATDKATYHISASLNRVADESSLADDELERVYLDENDGRQILHVTFGSVLTAEEAGEPLYRNRLLSLLNREAETYVEVLQKHIGRHIQGLMA